MPFRRPSGAPQTPESAPSSTTLPGDFGFDRVSSVTSSFWKCEAFVGSPPAVCSLPFELTPGFTNPRMWLSFGEL